MPASKRLLNKAILTVFLATAASPFMIPCSHAAETAGTHHKVSQEVAQTYQRVKNYTFKKKYQLVDWASFHMQALNEQIGNFERRMGQMSNLPMDEYSKAVRDIREKQKALSDAVDRLQESSAASWDESKQHFREAAEQLQQAYYDAVAKFEEHRGN